MRTHSTFIFLGLLVLAPASAHAFDCKKAATSIEKAICASPGLTRQDDELSKAYGSARAASSDKERKPLAVSQKRWIATRENMCGSSEGKDLEKCIGDETANRMSYLNAAPVSGPGYNGKLIPVLLQQQGSKTLYDLDYTLLKFAAPQTPAEKLLNAEAQKILDEAPLGPQSEESPAETPLSREVAFLLSYASPKMISVSSSLYSYEGGAHPNGGLSNINIDMVAGRMIQAADVFPSNARSELAAECKRQLVAEKLKRNSETDYDIATDSNFQEKTIADSIDDFSRWSIFADKATVTFDAYTVGSYAEGAYACEFPMARLKSMARPEAPLP
jgi:uncharacterized protein